MTSEKFLTKSWNNWLTLAMGIPILVLAIVYFSTDAMSDFAAFLTMIIAGAVY